MRLALSAALFAAASSFLPVTAASAATVTPAGTTVNEGNALALTFYVAPAHLAEAEAKAKSLQTIGSKDYHQFLTRQEFVDNYAVSDTELKAIEGSLQSLGFTIAYVFPNHLAIEVLGTVSTAEAALNIKLKTVPSTDGKTGFVPDRAITLPASLQGKIHGVGGLNTAVRPKPMHLASIIPGQATKHAVAGNNLVGGVPGSYLPADFARIYGVDPVYNQGYKGRGTTVGIVTLADFDASDAYTFWKQTGLSVSQSRITKVSVDGGVSTSNRNGEGETDLDVEYSGALAPDANVRVYVAPLYSNFGFTNGFEAVASDNIADTVSTSWGEPELYYFANAFYGYGSETYLLDEFHDVFLEMAIQGQTLYASSGDSGSFDTERGCSSFGTPSVATPVCNAPYAVESPADDPLVTAAGGTTLPFDVTFTSGLRLYNDRERAWAWDYIATEAAQEGFGANITLADVFSVGDGGGVSSYYAVPWYQKGHRGITKTVSGQTFTVDVGGGPVVDVTLPSNFAGRNLPDISTNADPESGYQYVQGGVAYNYEGGTSFVAPQLNGVTALFVEALGTRVGQINPAIYHLDYADTKDNSAGDNWGYSAVTGYDNAVGVGTLNASKLLDGLLYLKTIK